MRRKYTPSNRVRNHISKWEGSDFAGQNAQFGGDAVGAKANELVNMLGDDINNLTDAELDGLLSTYYNLSPRGFKKTIMPALKAYTSNPSDDTRRGLEIAMRQRYTIAPEKYRKGIRRRAAADTDLMNLSYTSLPIVEQPVNTRVVTTMPEEYIIPAALKDVWDAFEQGAVAIGKKKSDNISDFTMPSLSNLLEINSPKRQAELYMADILNVPTINMLPEYTYPTLLTLKNGRLPRFKDGVEYNISLPEVVITPDKNLVKRVRKTWPNPAVRKLALKEIERFKRFSEREPYDDPRFDFSLLDYFPWTSSLNVRIDNRNELPANYEVERAMQIVNESGNPDAYTFTGETPGITGKDRSYYRNKNLNSGFNGFVDAVGSKLGIKYFQQKRRGIHISPNDYERDPYFSELSHSYLHNNGLNSYGKFTNAEKTLNNSAYKDPNDIENQAHETILPLIYSYLRGEMPIRTLKDEAKDAIIARKQDHAVDGYSIFDTQISQEYEPFLTYKNGRLPGFKDRYKYSWNNNLLNFYSKIKYNY